jgi:uncharacterized protein (TIGR02246 family)
MRHCVALMAPLLLATTVSAVAQTEPADVLRAWSGAYATVDGARVAALYTEDARVWGTTSREQTVGRAAIAEYFGRQRPDAVAISVAFGEHALRKIGETTAVTSGHYTFSRRSADGRENPLPSRFSMVLSRGEDGLWRIVDHHSSRLPAAAQ